MRNDYPELATVMLGEGARYERSSRPAPLLHLDDPALEVMTDFRRVPALSCYPDVAIDAALELMKREGVRLLLVLDDKHAARVIGVITANDVQGERPIKIVATTRRVRAEIVVSDVMRPAESLPVLNMVNVLNARVGHVIETLKHLNRQHVLAVEIGPERVTVRGLFSGSQIAKQLGSHFEASLPPADSLARIQGELTEPTKQQYL